MRYKNRLVSTALSLSIPVALMTGCSSAGAPEATTATPSTAPSSEVDADAAQASETASSPEPSLMPSESPTPFNPICGEVASPDTYVAGEWSGFLGDDREETRIVFTEECQVMEGDDIGYNNPDGEWSQRGGNVEFVLVMTLSDDLPNLYQGSLDGDGMTLTGSSENGVFQFTRVTTGQEASPDPLADAPEGDAAAVAEDFIAQYEAIVPASSRDSMCELFRDSEDFVRGPLSVGIVKSLIEQGAQFTRGNRQQYELASYAYLEAVCL